MTLMTMKGNVIPWLTSSHFNVVCRQTQLLKTSAPISTCNAEDVFELLNPDDQKLTLYDLLEIRKQSVIEEAEEPKPEP